MVQSMTVEMMLAVLWNFTAVVMQEESPYIENVFMWEKADFELCSNIILSDLNVDYGKL
jgi:hypothetical protein